MARTVRRAARLLVGLGVAGVAWFMWSGVASAQNAVAPGCEVTGVSYSDGTTTAPSLATLGFVQRGDHLTVTFTVPAGCTDVLSFASYRAPGANFDQATAGQQVLFSSQSGTFTGGPHTLVVDVFGSPGGDPTQCSPQHDNSKGGGANQSPGPYDNTCNGSASQNGKSTNNNSKKPCAGCVGNADDKNPPGQYPNGNDPNAGYECDRNQGVGQTNPAHTGCQSFQVDFAYGPVIQHLGTDGFYNDPNTGVFRLIDHVNG